MDDKDATLVMETYAAHCVLDARDRLGVALDYTVASLSQAEAYLGELRARLPTGSLARSVGLHRVRFDEATKRLGGYLGELVRRARGDRWEVDAAQLPSNTAYVLVGPHGRARVLVDVERALLVDSTVRLADILATLRVGAA